MGIDEHTERNTHVVWTQALTTTTSLYHTTTAGAKQGAEWVSGTYDNHLSVPYNYSWGQTRCRIGLTRKKRSKNQKALCSSNVIKVTSLSTSQYLVVLVATVGVRPGLVTDCVLQQLPAPRVVFPAHSEGCTVMSVQHVEGTMRQVRSRQCNTTQAKSSRDICSHPMIGTMGQ